MQYKITTHKYFATEYMSKTSFVTQVKSTNAIADTYLECFTNYFYK